VPKPGLAFGGWIVALGMMAVTAMLVVGTWHEATLMPTMSTTMSQICCGLSTP
jgi:hypothetical protein